MVPPPKKDDKAPRAIQRGKLSGTGRGGSPWRTGRGDVCSLQLSGSATPWRRHADFGDTSLHHLFPKALGEYRFSTMIALPVALATFATIILATVALLWAIDRSDQISVERQIRTTQHAIDAIVDEVVMQQEYVAVWDLAAQEFRKQSPDWSWVDQNMSLWLYTTFGHDHLYILDPSGTPVYALIDGMREVAERYEAVRPQVQPLVDALLSPHTHGGDHPHRIRENTLLTSGKADYDAHLLEVFTRPAAASAIKIVPHTDATAIDESGAFVLLSIRIIDEGFLDELSARNLIDRLRFSSARDAAPDEEVLPLESDNGRHIGYFIWRPELPGTRILESLGPTMALACAALIAIMAGLVLSLRSFMTQLRTAWAEADSSELQARQLALYDTLTELPNRTLFNDRLEQALARTGRGDDMALLTVGLDRLKNVNDSLGHHAGDAVIAEFAGRISTLVRASDTVARLGGDEFAVIQTGAKDQASVDALCERIFGVVREPFIIGGKQVFVGASIGVALAPDDASSRQEIMRRSNIALYRAKAEGGDCWRYFTGEMDEAVKLRREIEEDLRAALATGCGLEVHFQPQVSGGDHEIVAIEALARWRHWSGNYVQPSQFIPIAEEAGLIQQLGEWVLRQACAASRRWPALNVAVNVSPAQFRSGNLVERLVAVVRECRADPSRIELEVTESMLLENDDLCRETLRSLRNAGFRIALDDFGTGYSSLSYLRRFEIDSIKIDQSFVRSIGQAVDSRAIVTAIITLGHAINLTVTAEGVETEEQEQFLARAGCDKLQGYYFARAVPLNELAEILAAQSGCAQRNLGVA